jgi:Domain of unknown function (DUF4390)
MRSVRHQPVRPTPAPAIRFVHCLRRAAAVVVWCAFALGCTEALAAESARITNLTIKTSRDHVTVSASLVQGLPADVGNELQQGISKILYYYVVLKRHVPLWMDEELDSSTVRFRIWYDLVKRQFVVAHRQGDTEVRQTVDRLEDVNRLISQIHDVTIPFTAPPRRSDTYYYVSVRAEMRSAKLPVYLEYFFFFLPVAQISTPWTDSAPIPLEAARR